MVKIDATGLKCPHPILIVASKSINMQPGDIIEVVADCPTFEKDVRVWCERTKKKILFLEYEDLGEIRCQIQC